MINNTLSRIKVVVRLTKEFIFLIGLMIIFFMIMNIWGHQENSTLWASIIVLFSIAKIYYLVMHTFKKLDVLIENNHSFNHMLLLLGAIITLIVVSFTMDYLCISEIYANAFLDIQYSQSIPSRFSNLLYFSIVTFTSVGYGDIAPVVPVAKLITVFEMISAFIMMVFVFSKYLRKNENSR
ncbi:MAG: hypothetical protein COB12_06175 [Flavobacterium sp.]|nr:MAG: hypothetical protein COB12_06175 [Flavobacterium sp.]